MPSLECNKENIDAVVVLRRLKNQILLCTGMAKPSLIWNVVSFDTNGVRVVVDAKVVDKDVKLPRRTSNIC